MKVTDEQLRALYQEQTARSGDDRSACVTEDELQRAATRTLGEDERARIAGHLRACADCAREYRALHALADWAADPQQAWLGDTGAGRAPARARPRVWPFSRWTAWAGVAAMVVVVIGSLALWPRRQSDVPADVERGDERSTVAVEPADGAVVAEPPMILRWTAARDADAYEVTLYDFEGTTLWESRRTTERAVQVPDTIRRDLAPDRQYFWRVTAWQGAERMPSGVFRFTLSPTPGAR